MLVVSRATNSFYDDEIRNFPSRLRPGDCVVLNDTRVFPARLYGRRNSPTGAVIEVFLLRPLDSAELRWSALVRPGKRACLGDCILFHPELSGKISRQGPLGERTVEFEAGRPIHELLDEIGKTPLPPYIHREPGADDRERYQTVFAKRRGSVAAPTAGLHFTPELLEASQAAGADLAYVTLHVGLGTFAPIRVADLEQIELHEETFELQAPDCEKMRRAERLVCVGTTSVRTVESALLTGALTARSGVTNLFIHPGFEFRGTGAMLTNFHLPESSLLMLVAAFGGYELIMEAYRHAVRNGYRFFSYGDCMFIE